VAQPEQCGVIGLAQFLEAGWVRFQVDQLEFARIGPFDRPLLRPFFDIEAA
jgi:hypothetical protein